MLKRRGPVIADPVGSGDSPAHRFSRWAGLVLLIGLVIGWIPLTAAADLKSELTRLAGQNRFTVDGLDFVRQEDIIEPIPLALPARVKELLKNYNHLIVSGPGGSIEKVVILGAKQPSRGAPAQQPIVITRDGLHHRVEALLTGPNGRAVPASLIIDTGASNIVLPESMMAVLGYRPEELDPSESLTASGTLAVKMGVLKTVSVGGNATADVGVSFVEDRKLGNLQLLGMSYLSRFRFTIDDEKSELILLSR